MKQIARRKSLQPFSIGLHEVIPEGELADFVKVLQDVEATITFKRSSGEELDRLGRDYNFALVKMAKLNQDFRDEYGEGENPEASELLISFFKDLFTSHFVSLTGFKDVSSAEDAWGAIYDFSPTIAGYLGYYILNKQAPPYPED